MKTGINTILLLAVIFLSVPAFSQDKALSLKAGYGYFQGFFAGVNYKYTPRLSAGFSAGSHFGLPPLEDAGHYSLTLENNFYFGQRRKWVFSQQASYWIQGYTSSKWKILLLAPMIGRDLSITERLTLSAAVGPAVNLVLDVEHYIEETSGWMWPILPNGIIQLSYSL